MDLAFAIKVYILVEEEVRSDLGPDDYNPAKIGRIKIPRNPRDSRLVVQYRKSI
jgi:hypothetical protein